MIVLATIVVGAALFIAGVLIAALTLQRHRIQDDDDGPRDSDGGSGRRIDGPRPHRPTGDQPQPPEPEWWPQFERDFAAYVAASSATTNRSANDAAQRGAAP